MSFVSQLKQTKKNHQKYQHPFSSHHLILYMRKRNAESQKRSPKGHLIFSLWSKYVFFVEHNLLAQLTYSLIFSLDNMLNIRTQYVIVTIILIFI